MTIESIHPLEYLLEYQKNFPSASGIFAREAGKKNGKILIAKEAEEPLGILILDVPAPRNYDISYLYIKAEKRNQGVASALLQEACALTKEDKKMIGLRVIEENAEAAVLIHLAQSFFFQKVLTAEIYRCIPTKEKTKENWNAFLDSKGQKLWDFLVTRGYCLEPFSQMTKKTKKSMENKLARNVFPKFADPFQSDKTDFEYSFVVSKAEEAVAFCAAEAYGDRIVLRSLAVDAAYQKKGPFLMPLIAFISKTIKEECPLVCYTVYSNNKEMLSLSGGFLTAVTDTVHHQNFYKK